MKKPMKKPVFLSTLLTLSALSSSLAAMDLSGVYEQARLKDATILAAQAGAAARRENLPMAQAQLRPNLAFSSSQSKNRLTTTANNFLGTPVTSHDGYQSGNTALVLRQPLYRPFNARAVEQAGFTVQEAEATLESEYQNLGNKVVGNYFEALFAEDRLRLIAAQKVFISAQLDAAKRALVAGSGTVTDIAEAQARLDMNLAQALEARQNVEYTRRQVEALMQQSAGTLAPLQPQALNLRLETRELQAWIDAAEAQSPDIRALKARVEAARIEVTKAEAGHLPTLDASAQWSISKSENLTAITSRYNTKAIGLSLNFPLYAGGYVSAQVRQALADLERQEQSLEAARRDLNSRVHAEYRGITEGALKVLALEQAARSAAQLVDAAGKSQTAGARTQLDVLNAEQQRVKAEEDLSRARYSYIVSLVKLWAMTGEADSVQIARVNAWLQPATPTAQ